MSILSNTPTLSYIYIKDMVITYNDVPYQISNTYTQKPYIYWSIDQPYELIISNKILKEKEGLYYIIFNQKGNPTMVPQTDIEVSFGEGLSRDLITEKILGFQHSDPNEEKFTTIQADINGIKQTVGTIQEDINGTKQTISEINQKADNVSASVSTLEREYTYNQELSTLREDTNIALLGLQSTLGIFSSDMNNFMEDNKLSDEESNQIDAYKNTMTTKLNDLNTQIDKIISLLESQEKAEDVTRLTTQKQLLNDSINNLLTNITTVCADKVFTNTEITTVVSYFANANTKINETNNMIDEFIFLETGGALIEEISKLNISQNEIKLSVSKTEQTTTEINNKVNATVKSVNVMYYLSTSTTELIGGTWTDVAPTWEADKYMWSKTVTTLTNGIIKESSPTCIAGAKGQDGVPGKDGASGQTTYTWIRYADDENGNGISNSPIGKTYIGFAYNKTTSTESNYAPDYKWSLIKGADGINGTDGANGIDGVDGKDGITYYTWIKYSDNANGSNMYDTPNDNTKYIGIATNQTEQTESSDYTKYVWSKFRGEDGADGADGVPGKDGTTTYTWIKYANDSSGNGISNDPTGKEYIGFAYNKTTSVESNSPSDYIWSLIKGADGVDGQDGKDGKDGTSVTILGNYNSVEELNQAHPNNNNNGDGYIVNGDLYVWDGNSFINVGKIKGEDGKNGVDGQDGKNGLNAYVHIKYSNDGGKTFTPSNGEEVGDYLGIYTDYYEADSADVTRYTWSKIKGQDGVPGTNGKDGVTTYTWIKYSDNEDGTVLYDTPNSQTKYIGIATNKTTATESTNKTDYVWSLFKGEDGEKGTGIESITEEYYLSTSKVAQTDGSWTTTPPAWEYGKYMWTRSKIVYKDPASTVYTTPICDSSWEVVDEIGIGGRNYIYFGLGNNNKGMFIDNKWTITDDYAEATLSSANIYDGIYIFNGFILKAREYEVGEQYTWSYDFMITDWTMPEGANIVEWWMGQRYTAGTSESSDGAWRPVTQHDLPKIGTNGVELNNWIHVTKTITIPEQAHSSIDTESSIKFYQSNANVTASITFRIKNVKIEKGNKATDWTPSPEEIQSQIDSNKTEIQNTKETVAEHTTSLNSITSRVSSTEKDITTIQNKVNIAIKDVYTMYYLSTSSTQLIDGTWSKDVPSDISYNYLWTKTVTVYIDNTTSESDPICNTAISGEDGEPGYTVILSDETFIVQCDLSGNPL